MTNGGSLVVELLDNYTPQDGDTITLVQSDDVVGDFSSVSVLGTPDGFDAEVQIDSGNVVLTLTGVSSPPGEVRDVVVSQGANQRSMLMEIDVTFSGDAQFGAAAFSLVHRGDNGSVDVSVASSTVDGDTVATLTFSGQYSEPSGSLIDGNYTLTVDGSEIVDSQGNNYDDVDGDGSPGGEMVMGDQADDNFYRLYGDIDRDRQVSIFDFFTFRSAFSIASGDPSFESGFDQDVDGVISIFDFFRFRTNFGKMLPFE